MKKSNLSLVDDVGQVYFDLNMVVRIINDESISDVKELLASGLIADLIGKGLLVKTSELKQKDGVNYLEHELISPVVYPYEWSPEMLRLAARCTLKINKIANTYGYELKDAHPYNIVFKGAKPIFVDFGSFAKRGEMEWVAAEGFYSSYIYPLKIYSMGLKKFFKNMFLVDGKGVSAIEFYTMKFPALRMFKVRHLEIMLKVMSLIANSGGCNAKYEKYLNKIKLNFDFIRLILNYILNSNLICNTRYVALNRKLTEINLSSRSYWGDYHEIIGLYSKRTVNLTDRYAKIISMVEELKIKSVTELAGNQGVLSAELCNIENIETVICTDYDEVAIDKLIVRSAQEGLSIFPAVVDFMRLPIAGRGNPSSERFRADLVIALAVTHHLILTQKYNLHSVIENILKYTNKYLIVEFMPMGLYSERSGWGPTPPVWYTEEWFVKGLQTKVIIKERIVAEKNRIIYLCEKNLD